jgi:hypothetical protein
MTALAQLVLTVIGQLTCCPSWKTGIEETLQLIAIEGDFELC